MKQSALAIAIAVLVASCATVPPIETHSGRRANMPSGVNDGVLTPRNSARQPTSDTDGDQGPSREMLKALVETMRCDIERGEFSLAQIAFDTVEGRLALAEDDPVRQPFVAELCRLDAQAKDLSELREDHD